MMDKIVRIILIIFASIFLVAMINMGVELSNAINARHSGYAGFYNHGTITIKASKLIDKNQYEQVSMHEWAHYLWATQLSKEEKKTWNMATHACGFQSEYAQTYKSPKIRLEEEWADNYAQMTTQNDTFCLEKQALIAKYA